MRELAPDDFPVTETSLRAMKIIAAAKPSHVQTNCRRPRASKGLEGSAAWLGSSGSQSETPNAPEDARQRSSLRCNREYSSPNAHDQRQRCQLLTDACASASRRQCAR